MRLNSQSLLQISGKLAIPTSEIDISAIRAQGAGGQNVNKVATGIHLRFDIRTSSLPDFYKERLLKLHDQRITDDGVIIIKAQRFRSQEKNRDDGLARLRELIRSVSDVPKKRRPTRPTRSSQRQRLDTKSKRARTKELRKKVTE